MNDQSLLPIGTPAASPSSFELAPVDQLLGAVNVVSQMAKTTSDYTRDMQAVGVETSDAFWMLAGTLALTVGVAAVLGG